MEERMRITRSMFVSCVCSAVSLTIIILPDTIRYIHKYDICRYDMYTHKHLLTGCVCPLCAYALSGHTI